MRFSNITTNNNINNYININNMNDSINNI